MSGPLLDMRLAWRAAVGKNSARVSLVVRLIGVAFAVLILLLAASASGALDSRGDRTTWRTQWGNGIDLNPQGTTSETGAWIQVGWDFDYYYGREIQRVRVARYAPEAEVPPGLPRIPEPGESFVSPALLRLIESDPDVLAHRYGDTIAGTISNAGLSDADELVVISGHPASETHFFGQLYRELPAGFDETGITALMWAVITIGVVVLLFPVALFIASAARLNAQESDARLAAFRLAGAAPRRVRWIVAWESLLSALPGALLGLGLFFATRPIVAQVEFQSAAFFASDFTPGLLGLLVVLLTPAVVVGASLYGLRDVEISPLGVSRNAVVKEVRPFGLVFLAAGFAALWFVLDGQDNRVTPTGLVLSILLILVGLAMAGTWLGQAVARVALGAVRSAPSLLAFRRIVRDPHASFRTVSGVTFAVFAGTLFLSLSAALEREVEVIDFSGFRDDVTWMGHEPDAAIQLENAPPGTTTVPIRELGGALQSDSGVYFRIYEGNCVDFARVLRMEGGCEGRFAMRAGAGAKPGDEIIIDWVNPPVTIVVPADVYEYEVESFGSWTPDIVLPPGTLPAGTWDQDGSWTLLAIAPPDGVRQGSREFELIRTAAMRAYPMGTVHSAREFDSEAIGGLETMKNLVYAGTFAAFLLSGGTAAMAVAGSIIARRKAFALLRMAGVPLGALRKTIITEATLPLALVSAISASVAVAVSAMMINRIGEGSVLPPPEFILPLVAGLVVGLALPLITLPMLGRVTAMERTRFE